MGIKQIVAGIVAACGMMAIHSPAWALAVNPTPVTPMEYRMPDGSPMTSEQVAMVQELGITPEQMAVAQQMMVAQASGKPMIKVESWTWVLSVIPGLGQFLMGDMMKGIIIFIIAAIVPPVLGMVIAALGFITGGLAWIISPIIGIAALVFWLWNLWDAYNMNQRMMGKSAEIQITPELRARRNDGDVALNYTFGRF